MKLATLKDGRAVLVRDDRFLPLADGGFRGSLLDFARAPAGVRLELAAALDRTRGGQPLDPAALDAPLRPPKIVAIGLNYRLHAAEAGQDLPKEPLVFTKFTSAVAGPRDPVLAHEDLTSQLDYEVELAVVIGATARRVPEDRALEHVLGYTVANDLSARDLQFADGQWVRGKSLDTSCPLGPWIVTADEIPDPGALALGCDVNGIPLQRSSTAGLIFGVPQLVSRLSRSFTLEPGDVILTGTPEGVGMSRTPPVFLKPGDLVRTWVDGIGELRNPVVASAGPGA